jgi:hypothetical protein
MRTTDDLIRMATPTTAKEVSVLREFSEHCHANPELFPFLERHARAQIRKFGWVCFDAAWAGALMELRIPGGPEFKLTAKLKAWYVRAILYSNSDLNGWLEIRRAAPDSVFGMAVAKKLPGDYAGRLEWRDGRPLTDAPTQVVKKAARSVRPAQAELFEVAG